MASPAAAGLSTNEIKRRLAEVQRQYEQMQRKLQKSAKAEKARGHVRHKIADYNRRQAQDGSPECTTSMKLGREKAAVTNASSQSPARPAVSVATGSPHPPEISRGPLFSESPSEHPTKKSSKRRSVSFALEAATASTGRKRSSGNRGSTFKLKRDHGKKPVVRADAVSSEKSLSEDVSSSCLTTSKHDVDRSRTCHKLKPMQAAPARHVDRKSTTGAVEKSRKLPFQNVEMLDAKKKQSVNASQKWVTKITHFEKAVPKPVQKRAHSTGTQLEMQESHPGVMSPPEDTQFDLFADADPEDDSVHIVEVSLESDGSTGNGSHVLMVTSDASKQTLSPFGGRVDSKGTKPSLDVPLRRTCQNDDTCLDESVQVVVLDHTEGEGIIARKLKASALASKAVPLPDAIYKVDQTKKELHKDLPASRPTGVGDPAKNSTPSTDGHNTDYDDDPDVIPSTFPEDDKQHTGHDSTNSNHVPTTGIPSSQKSEMMLSQASKPLQQENKQDMPKLYVQPETANRKPYPKGLTCRGEIAQDKDKDIGHSVPLKCGEMKELDLVKSKNSASHEENVQGTVSTSQSKNLGACEEGGWSEDLKVNKYNTSQNVVKNTQEIHEKHGKLSARKGRRKSVKRQQRSIDNLTMDDVSLKDFVLSQQSSQDGNHTWIDGLMYPAEYYVRKTRSMSKPSPTLHSAPLPGQGYPSKTSRTRNVHTLKDTDLKACSEPLAHADPHEMTTKPPPLTGSWISSVTEGSYVEFSSPHVHLPGTCGTENKEESVQHTKMKVPGKQPSARRKRRGRKPSVKKETESSLNLQTIETGNVAANENVQRILSDYCDIDCDSSKSTDRAPDVTVPTEVVVLDEQNSIDSQHRDLSVAATSTPQKSSLDGSHTTPTEEASKNHPVFKTSLHPKSLSSTQATYNPLESQFTQTQFPEDFALPSVFSSPGHPVQSLVGLSPGSPTSSCVDHRGIATMSPGEGTTVQTAQQGMPLQVKDDLGEQWMSQAYLADMVPELPADPEGSLDNPEEHHNAVSSLTMCDSHETELSQGVGVIEFPVVEVHLNDGFEGTLDQNSQGMPVLDRGTEIHHQYLCDEHIPCSSLYPCNDVEESIKVEATPKSLKHVINQQMPPDEASEDTHALTFTLQSNANLDSPCADAATGTPPEIAEMPLTESQCTNSCRGGPEEHPGSNQDRVSEGINHPVKRRHGLHFRGCLQHIVKDETSVKGIVTTTVLISNKAVQVTAVSFCDKVIFWTGTEGRFQLLCSWDTTGVQEQLVSTHFMHGCQDAMEAVITLEDDNQTQSIRLIRWDCTEQGEWEERSILSSEDMQQRQQRSSTLCVLGGKRVAVGVSSDAGSSEVVVLDVSREESSTRRTRADTATFLGGSDGRVNSLVVVEGAPDMLMGMTDTDIMLWHVVSRRLVKVFDVRDHPVNHCIQATAESGLLFVVAFNKRKDVKDKLQGLNTAPSCCLLALNPSNGRSSKLLDYSAPCLQSGVGIQDVSLSDGLLAASLSNGQFCMWDLYSSRLLATSSTDLHGNAKTHHCLCLQDSRTFLIGSEQCVTVYERDG